MKLIHLSDLHLGKRVNEYSMLEDQEYILKKIINVIDDEKPDGVIIAGDVYDKSIPSAEAVQLFDDFLVQLAKRSLKVFVISGNHDSPERIAFGSRIMDASGIHMSPVYSGDIAPISLEDEFGMVNVYMLPFIKPAHVRRYAENEITTYTEAVEYVISKLNIDPANRNVLVTHQFVTGALRSESEEISVGGSDNVDTYVFEPFDYVALGHIHSAQCVGRETIRYAGSPLKYSLNQREILSEKSVPVITMEEKGKVEVTLCPLKPMREVRKIKGELKTLIENAVDTEDYIYATLTDEEFQFDAMARLREVYPNIMKMDYDNATTRAMQENETDIGTEEKSFKELVEDFYQLLNGRMPNEKEWKLIEEEAKEAGILE